MVSSGNQSSYDMFLSFAGPDREINRVLYSKLSSLGLRVFLDEYSIKDFESITSTIEHGLGASKALVAYYSKHFTDRTACQLELSAAYVGAQRKNELHKRIIAINPEATSDHILPPELVSAGRVIQTDSSVSLSALARTIRKRIAPLDGPIGDVSAGRRPRQYYGPFFGSPYFTGRYPELWDIHSALSKSNDRPHPYGSTVSVTGQDGAGKSTLVAQYMHLFGTAFENVYWSRLNNGKGYSREVQQFARLSGIEVAHQTLPRLLGSLAVRMDRQPKPSLWVVDDIPPDFKPAALRQFLPPSQNTYNVLISDENVFNAQLPTVKVGSLPLADARNVVSYYRQPENERESQALDRLVVRLNGHARSLNETGRQLQDMQGILSYDDY